jgi:hypothetical protein
MQSMMWTEADNGISFRELVTPGEDAATPVVGQLVALSYTATYLSSGQIIDGTGDKPLTFALGEEYAFFAEAIAGMKIGGKRRLNLAPSSKYSSADDASTADETIQFEIELIGIPTGLDALSYRLVRNQESIVRTAILLTFIPDVLRFIGLMPEAVDSASSLREAFHASGFGSVDILSVPPVVADAANQWAAQGLQGLS